MAFVAVGRPSWRPVISVLAAFDPTGKADWRRGDAASLPRARTGFGSRLPVHRVLICTSCLARKAPQAVREFVPSRCRRPLLCSRLCANEGFDPIITVLELGGKPAPAIVVTDRLDARRGS